MQRNRTSGTTEREFSITGERLALLAVLARPEEEGLGPAGTLAKYASEGIRVSMVTATRAVPSTTLEMVQTGYANDRIALRDKSCSCLTSGTVRICLMDNKPGRLEITDESATEERLVRLIRELEPQVIITVGPEGITSGADDDLVSRLTLQAFSAAGDPSAYPQHLRDGLPAFQPKKLYYFVIPESQIAPGSARGLASVPDSHVTAVLDVSPFTGSGLRTLYCQRHQTLDYGGELGHDGERLPEREYFILAASQMHRKPRHERDLFAGLR